MKSEKTEGFVRPIMRGILILLFFFSIQTTCESKQQEPQSSIPEFRWELVGIYDNDLKISIDMNNVELDEDNVVRYWTKNESMYPDSNFYTLDFDEVKIREKTIRNIKRLIYFKNGEVKVIEFPISEGKILEKGPIPLEFNYLVNNHPKFRDSHIEKFNDL